MIQLSDRKKSFWRLITGVLILILVLIIFCSLYLGNINIYGNLKIYVYQNNKSVSDSVECTGISIFNREFTLEKNDSCFVIPNYSYFNHLCIDLTKTDKSVPVKIVIKDEHQKLFEKSVAKKGVLIVNDLNYNHNLFEKILSLDYYVSKRLKKILVCIQFILILSVLLLVIKKNIKSLVNISLLISFGFFELFIFQLFIKEKILLWSGFFLLFAVSIWLILILYKLINKENKQNLLTVFVSILVGLLMAEFVLRILGVNVTSFEKRFGYYESIQYKNRIVPYDIKEISSEYHLTNSEFDYKRVSNSMGLSGEEIKAEKADGEFLIIGLGDSFTEGDGAHADSTWLKFLERKLPDNDSVDYRFINAGICGSDPIYEYKLLKDKLVGFKPDLVIVAYGYEMIDLETRGGFERFETMKTPLEEHWWKPVYSVSFVSRLLVHNLLGYNDLLMTDAEFNAAYKKALTDLKQSLVKFQDLANSNDFELLIVFYPQKNEIDNGQFVDNYPLVQFANEKGINNLNLLKYYLGIEKINQDNSQKYYWKKDGHHNAAGYEKFANGVLWKLKQMTILPE